MPGFGRGRGGRFGGDRGGFGRSPERPSRPPPPPEKPKPQEVWEQDPQFEARCARMLEHAKRLKCEEAYRAMLAVVRITEGFSRMENIFTGPSRQKIAEQQRMLGRNRSEEEAEEEAWREVHRKFEQFDMPDSRGASDWGRALGTFKAAIIPGEGIPGALDVTAPPQGSKGEERWQRFEVWCEGNNLNARGLCQVAETLKGELQIYRKDREDLKSKLDAFRVAQLDQIIMAGYSSLEDVRVSSGFSDMGYKPLAGLMSDLDPEREKSDTDAAFAAAEKARNDFMKSHASPPRPGKKTWTAISYKARNEWDSLWREAMAVFDQAYEAESAKLHTPAPVLEISNQSAALTRSPVAIIVARRSHIGDRHFAHGIHPVSPELIRTLAGDAAVYAVKPYLRFDKKTGQVVSEQNFHLLQHSGPLLETRVMPEKSPEGVAVFAKALMEGKGNISDELPFVFANERLISDDADRICRCSRGTLKADEFDLEAWYRGRLVGLGNITGVAEAKEHVSDLTLSIVDIFPGQEQRIAQLEKEYPKSIAIHGHTYPIEYHYRPARGEKDGEVPAPEALSAVIKITGSGPKEQLLQWPSDTRVVVGPPADPTAVRFAVSVGGFAVRVEETDNVTIAQEIIDATRLREEWDKYTDKDKGWWVPVRVEDSFPEAAQLVSEQFLPYAAAKNGEPKLPIPAVQYIGNKSFKEKEYGVRIVLYPTQRSANEAEANSRHQHKENQERAERIKAANPEQLRRAQELRDTLVARLRAVDWKQNVYARLYGRDINEVIPDVNRLLEDGCPEKALPKLERLEKALHEQVERPWELFQKGKTLLAELIKKMIGSSYRWKDLFDERRYAGEYSREKPPTIEVLTRALQEMRDALAMHETRQK